MLTELLAFFVATNLEPGNAALNAAISVSESDVAAAAVNEIVTAEVNVPLPITLSCTVKVFTPAVNVLAVIGELVIVVAPTPLRL